MSIGVLAIYDHKIGNKLERGIIINIIQFNSLFLFKLSIICHQLFGKVPNISC